MLDQLVDLAGVLVDRRVLADVVGAEGDDDEVGIALGEDLGENVGAGRRLAADGDPPADLGEHRDVGIRSSAAGDDLRRRRDRDRVADHDDVAAAASSLRRRA